MINLTYYYSACVGITTKEVSILCDPWFTPGAYDGSWHQYPAIKDPIEVIGQYDVIYISHIHPDHYDPVFLRKYLSHYPDTEILIAPFAHNHLARKMTIDGFPHRCVDSTSFGTTELKLVPNGDNLHDIDSALVVCRDDQALVNMNDNPYSDTQIAAIQSFVGSKRIAIALLPYAGAGPYPQTYYQPGTTLDQKAEEKKQQFFQRYLRLRDALNADVNLPFAGKYLLGGRLGELNHLRGVPDAVAVRAIDERAVILADGGQACINTDALQPSEERTLAYTKEQINNAAQAIKDWPMSYEKMLASLPLEAIPFKRLLPKAYASAWSRSTMDEDYIFCIKIDSEYYYCNCNQQQKQSGWTDNIEQFPIRSVLQIDYRYLFGLLTGLFHWDNAKVGSHLRVERIPDHFERQAEQFLDFFHL